MWPKIDIRLRCCVCAKNVLDNLVISQDGMPDIVNVWITSSSIIVNYELSCNMIFKVSYMNMCLSV